jgi:hypothetical protein
VKALKEEVGLPIHFHTHDTSGIAAASILRAADAGRGHRRSRHRLDERQHLAAQPQLHRRRPAAHAARHGPRPRRAEPVLRLLGAGARVLPPFDTAPKTGSAEVYLHEMPGGQYTNLKEQAASMGVAHRWPEIARTYAEVNQLFGDIVKVTPSLQGRRRHGALPLQRAASSRPTSSTSSPATPFPESVIDMLSGGLGWPAGGWPAARLPGALDPRGRRSPASTRPPAKYPRPEALAAASETRESEPSSVGHRPRPWPTPRPSISKSSAPSWRKSSSASRVRRRPVLAPDVPAGLRRLSRSTTRVRRRQRAAHAGVLLRPQAGRGNLRRASRRARCSSSASSRVGEPDKDGRRAGQLRTQRHRPRAADSSTRVSRPKTKARPKADLAIRCRWPPRSPA